MTEFRHPCVMSDPTERARQFILFAWMRDIRDTTRGEIEYLMKNTDILKQVADMGECVAREKVVEMINANLAMIALKDDK